VKNAVNFFLVGNLSMILISLVKVYSGRFSWFDFLQFTLGWALLIFVCSFLILWLYRNDRKG
jgi:hypothetical protein